MKSHHDQELLRIPSLSFEFGCWTWAERARKCDSPSPGPTGYTLGLSAHVPLYFLQFSSYDLVLVVHLLKLWLQCADDIF